MEKLFKKYITKRPTVSADALVINEKRELLLTKRSISPYKGYWVLPGGHISYGETAEKALKREVFEETGFLVEILRLFGVYSSPKRDPRYHMISICYEARISDGSARPNKEVEKISFFNFRKLPKKIGFDHKNIINDYVKEKKYEKSKKRSKKSAR